jgi:hypothetical protein
MIRLTAKHLRRLLEEASTSDNPDLETLQVQLQKLNNGLITAANAVSYAISLAGGLERQGVLPGRIHSYLAACEGGIIEADENLEEAKEAMGQVSEGAPQRLPLTVSFRWARPGARVRMDGQTYTIQDVLPGARLLLKTPEGPMEVSVDDVQPVKK